MWDYFVTSIFIELPGSSLNEGLCTLAWPIGKLIGGVLNKLMWAQSGQHHSLDRGPELCESGEIELSTSKQASTHALASLQDS